MPISLVLPIVANSTQTAGTSINATRTDVQAGDIILVTIEQGTATKKTITITDSKGQSYSQIGTATEIGGADDTSITQYYTQNVAAGSTTVTCTFGGAITFAAIWVDVIRGGATSGSVGGSAFAGQVQIGVGNTADAISTGNGTPGAGSAWLIVAHSMNASSGAPAPVVGTGFTSSGTAWDFAFGIGDFCRGESKRITSSSAAPATFTRGTAGTDTYVTVMTMFGELSSAPPDDGLFFGNNF